MSFPLSVLSIFERKLLDGLGKKTPGPHHFFFFSLHPTKHTPKSFPSHFLSKVFHLPYFTSKQTHVSVFSHFSSFIFIFIFYLFFFLSFSSTHSPNLRIEAPRLKPHLSPNLKLIRGPSLTCSSLPPPPSSLSLSLMFSILVDLVFVGFGWI